MLASDFEGRFKEVVDSVCMSDEFVAYRGQTDRLLRRLSVDSAPRLAEDYEYRRVELAQELAGSRATLLRETLRLRARRGWFIVVLVIGSAIAFAATTWSISNKSADPVVAWVTVASLLVGALLSLLIVALRSRRRLVAAKAGVDQLAALTDSQMREWLEVNVAAAYSSAIAAVLAEEGLVDFPRSAPRLVELEIDGIVPSRAIERVMRFVFDHETSAIGITGPRGAGKSTLLQAVKREVLRREGRAIVIPSPVQHDPVDLLRLLAQAMLEDEDGRVGSRIREDRLLESLRKNSRSGRLIALFGVLLLSLGGALFVISLEPSVARSLTAALQLSWLSWVAIAIGATGLGATVLGIQQHSQRRRLGLGRRSGLAELVEDINYERMTGSTFGGKAGSGIEISAEVQASRTAREVTHARLVTDLRSELQRLGASTSGPVFIAIDELDKLPRKEDLLATVNTLKDLLHLRNVHVALTLSDDALNSFELRETNERDAFDSTFDVVVDVDRLDEADAQRVIESRVAGFPPPLAKACYVWSAGLPRDLLRHARACIELVKTREDVPPWYDVALELSQIDTLPKVRALMRSGTPIEECDFLQKLASQWATRAPHSDDLTTSAPLSDLAAKLCAYMASRFACIWYIRRSEAPDQAPPTALMVFRDAAAAAPTSAGLEVARRALLLLE